MLIRSNIAELVTNIKHVKGDLEKFEIEGETIERVKQFKYLGAILDDKLVFEKNIERIINLVNGKLISLARL